MNAGDEIGVVERSPDDWLFGAIMKGDNTGSAGWLPNNYVEPLPTNGLWAEGEFGVLASSAPYLSSQPFSLFYLVFGFSSHNHRRIG